MTQRRRVAFPLLSLISAMLFAAPTAAHEPEPSPSDSASRVSDVPPAPPAVAKGAAKKSAPPPAARTLLEELRAADAERKRACAKGRREMRRALHEAQIAAYAQHPDCVRALERAEERGLA